MNQRPDVPVRCALMEGFSLHAHTHLHANDRQGLERLCRYGARGALALERLSRVEGGRIAYSSTAWSFYGVSRPWFLHLEQTSRDSTASPLRARNSSHFAPQAGGEPYASKRRAQRREWAGQLNQDVRAGRLRLRTVWRQA